MTDKYDLNLVTSHKYITINNSDICEGNNTKLHLSKCSVDDYSLDELQAIVGGNIEIIPMGEGLLVINECGKLEGLETNLTATSIWFDDYGQSDIIVGNALYCMDTIDIDVINYAFKTCQATRRNINTINSMQAKLDWELVV